MSVTPKSSRRKSALSALFWILTSTTTVLAIGLLCLLFAWKQAEDQRLNSWKQGWNYAGASQALKIYPNAPASHIAMASVWVKNKKLNSAIQEYQKALKLEPANAYTHLDLGNAFSSNGQVLKARAQWRIAVRIDVAGGNAAKEASEELTKTRPNP